MVRVLPQPSVDSLDMTTVLAALADPARLSVMRAIYRRTGAIDCSVLNDDIDLSAPTMSHHWRILREAGLTSTTVVGRTRRIEIRYEDLESRFPGLIQAILAPERIDSHLT